MKGKEQKACMLPGPTPFFDDVVAGQQSLADGWELKGPALWLQVLIANAPIPQPLRYHPIVRCAM